MTTHPNHGQDVPMATRVDHLADSDSPLASRAPELTARFINDALPYLNQLNDRARRMTRNAVDAEDLMQETMLRAYAGFNTFSERTNLRAWLFRVMTSTYINGLRRAQHRPSEYLTDPMRFRPAVYYRDIAGLRCREVAEIMACCEGSVSSRLYRRRQRLRTLLRTRHGRA
jgi:RNA polymerase sigma-70 factor (ECF subfamily)